MYIVYKNFALTFDSCNISAQSPALNRLMHERYTKTIVNDFSYRTIKGMVDFIYGREVTDFEANAVDLLKAAHKVRLA